MASDDTLTTFDGALKQLYRESNTKNLTYTRRPLLGMLPKYEKFGGRNMPVVLLYGNSQGRSADFATAQSNTTATKIEDFLLTRVNDYSVATIDGDLIDSAGDSTESFLNALKTKIDGAMNALSDAIETFLFRSGTGTIGQVSSGSTVSADEITLEDINDVTNFEVGMTLRGTSTDGGAYDTGSEVLEAINRSTGVLTATSAAWNTVMTALAASDYLAVSGDAANGGANVKISGLDAWCPATTTSTSFFGVDRTIDSRLSGLYYDGSTGDTIEELAIEAQSMASQHGSGAPDCFIMNHVQNRKLIKQLGAKKEYHTIKADGGAGMTASIGYQGVKILGDHGDITVVAANKCPSSKAWMLEKSSWLFATKGNAVKFLDRDGLRIMRQANADGYEVRVGFRGNLSCKAPIHNVHVAMPS